MVCELGAFGELMSLGDEDEELGGADCAPVVESVLDWPETLPVLDCGAASVELVDEEGELLLPAWLLDCGRKLFCGGGGEFGGGVVVSGGVVVEFGVVGVLFGLLVPLDGFSLIEPCEGDSPLTPVVLPELDDDPMFPEDALPALEPLLATVKSSFTFLTPGTDFANFLASFLSPLLGTEPVKDTAPLSTLI